LIRPIIQASSDNILREMELADYGEHNLLIYPNLNVLTKVYSQYIKSRLQANMELVLFLSTYQSVNQVRYILKDKGLDIAQYERNGSLVILDSARGYFGPESDILLFLRILSKRAQNQGKDGCSVFADTGLFNLFGQQAYVLKSEVLMPSKFDESANTLKLCKTFCIYHQSDFNRFAEGDKESILGHHYRNLVITEDNLKSIALNT
jgi:DcmR-like sensory protein